MSDTVTIRRRVSLCCIGYALAIIAVALLIAGGGPDGVWLLMLTVPGSLLVALLPSSVLAGNAYWAMLTLVGLVQAWLVWRLLIRLLAHR